MRGRIRLALMLIPPGGKLCWRAHALHMTEVNCGQAAALEPVFVHWQRLCQICALCIVAHLVTRHASRHRVKIVLLTVAQALKSELLGILPTGSLGKPFD